MKNRLKTGSYTCQACGLQDDVILLCLHGVVDDTTPMKFANRACAVHGISLPVIVGEVVVVLLKFPLVNRGYQTERMYSLKGCI